MGGVPLLPQRQFFGAPALAGLRQLLPLHLVVLTLGLLYTALNTAFDSSCDAAWNFFARRGILIYGLVVGIQANYAAATSVLRLGPPAVPAAADAAVPLPGSGAGFETQEPGAPVAATRPAAAGPLLPAAPLPPELGPWRDKLLALMADEQLRLEPELTLTELAHRLRTCPARPSKAINAGCGQNFNASVNTYRVEEAWRKLATLRFGHHSLGGPAAGRRGAGEWTQPKINV